MTLSICECGCSFEVGSTKFQNLHVERNPEEAEQREILLQEYEERIASLIKNGYPSGKINYWDEI